MVSRYFRFSHATPALHADGKDEAAEAYLRPHAVLVIVLIAIWGIWVAGQTGLSKLYTAYSKTSGSLGAVEKAIALSESDPDAHHAHAIVLQAQGMPVEAVEALKRAVALRPRDYFLWLELGGARDNLSDKQGTLAALREAGRLAPYYSQPHWQLGNFLLREGDKEAAFLELRRAARRDQSLLKPTIQLAWDAYGGDVEAVQQALKLQNAAAQMAFARFLIRQDRVTEGLNLYRLARRDDSRGHGAIIEELVATKHFAEAVELLRTPQTSEQDRRAVITGMVAAGRSDEAAALLRQFELPDRVRRAVLTGLLNDEKFAEAIALLREPNATEQERRTALTRLITAERFDEAFELAKTMDGTDRSRRTLLMKLLEADRLVQATELVRAEGTTEQDRDAVLTKLLAAKMLTEAVELVRATGIPQRRRRDLLKSLFDAKRYAEGFQVWSRGREGSAGGEVGTGDAVSDGGFEGNIVAEEYGFGWHLPKKMEFARASLDGRDAHGGARSLRFEFSGDPRMTDGILSQLAVVAPGAQYRLSFAARTHELVSGCLPVVAVIATGTGHLLAQSAPLSQGTSGWTRQNIGFSVPPQTTAVTIIMHRDTETGEACPIFGNVWLDSFSLQRL